MAAAQLGQLPFTSDKAEELYEAVMQEFQDIADDQTLLISKLNELKGGESYSENTQFEQITFRDLNSLPIISGVERVQLNEVDKEMSLLRAVVSDVGQRYSHKERPPVEVKDLRRFQSEPNTITASVSGIPFTGVSVLAFILVADRLLDLRPSFKDTIGEKITIQKLSNDTKFKSLCDEDVWFSHL